jgi:hypothetical protein
MEFGGPDKLGVPSSIGARGEALDGDSEQWLAQEQNEFLELFVT